MPDSNSKPTAPPGPGRHSRHHLPAGALPSAGALLAAAAVAAAVLSYGGSREARDTDALPGSPLYGRAVHEAIQGLKGGNAQPPAANRPPLPAGLSPADYYWCDKCQAYHKRQPDAAAPAAPAPAPAAQAAPQPAAGQPAPPPPLPAGLSPADYYWCEKCQSYHRRDAAPPPPQAPAPQQAPAPPAAPAAPSTPRPPPPATAPE